MWEMDGGLLAAIRVQYTVHYTVALVGPQGRERGRKQTLLSLSACRRRGGLFEWRRTPFKDSLMGKKESSYIIHPISLYHTDSTVLYSSQYVPQYEYLWPICDWGTMVLCLSHSGEYSRPISASRSPCLKNSSMHLLRFGIHQLFESFIKSNLSSKIPWCPLVVNLPPLGRMRYVARVEQ